MQDEIFPYPVLNGEQTRASIISITLHISNGIMQQRLLNCAFHSTHSATLVQKRINLSHKGRQNETFEIYNLKKPKSVEVRLYNIL